MRRKLRIEGRDAVGIAALALVVVLVRMLFAPAPIVLPLLSEQREGAFSQGSTQGSLRGSTQDTSQDSMQGSSRGSSQVSSQDFSRGSSREFQGELFYFDPNTLDSAGFVRLGFSVAQTQSLLRYRASGALFRRPEDFARSYVVSERMYGRLASYIRIESLLATAHDAPRLANRTSSPDRFPPDDLSGAGSHTSGGAGNQIGSYTDSGAGNQKGSRIDGRTDGGAGNQIGSYTDSGAGGLAGSYTDSRAGNHISSGAGGRTDGGAGNQTGSGVGSNTSGGAGNSTGGEAGSQIGGEAGSYKGSGAGGGVGDGVGRLVRVEINGADTSQLKRLRGIGSYYARKMVQYRTLLGGFVLIEQLLEVEGMDGDRLSMFGPQVEIDYSLIRKIDLKTADQVTLGKHPYIGPYAARWIVHYREQLGDTICTPQSLLRRNILKPHHALLLEYYVE